MRVQNLFNQIGTAGAGLILIIVGIFFATSGISTWSSFCITLGISIITFAGAKESEGALQIVVGIISAGFFLVAIGILLASL